MGFDVEALCAKTKKVSNAFLSVSTEKKNELLSAIKKIIIAGVEELKKVNAIDVEEGKKSGMNPAFADRLLLTDGRIKSMCDGIDDVIALPDYVGKVEESYTLKNGLEVKKVHAPLGVVGIIY